MGYLLKTRIVVHIALNAKNERVGNLVEVVWRFIPFEGWCFANNSKRWSCREVNEWINHDYNTELTLKNGRKTPLNSMAQSASSA